MPGPQYVTVAEGPEKGRYEFPDEESAMQFLAALPPESKAEYAPADTRASEFLGLGDMPSPPPDAAAAEFLGLTEVPGPEGPPAEEGGPAGSALERAEARLDGTAPETSVDLAPEPEDASPFLTGMGDVASSGLADEAMGAGAGAAALAAGEGDLRAGLGRAASIIGTPMMLVPGVNTALSALGGAEFLRGAGGQASADLEAERRAQTEAAQAQGAAERGPPVKVMGMEVPQFWNDPYVLGGAVAGIGTSPPVGPGIPMAQAGKMAPFWMRMLASAVEGMPMAIGGGGALGWGLAEPGARLEGAVEGGLEGAAGQAVMGPLFEAVGTPFRHVGDWLWNKTKRDIIGGGAAAEAVEAGLGEPRTFARPGEEVSAGLAAGPDTRKAFEGSRAVGQEIHPVDIATMETSRRMVDKLEEVTGEVGEALSREKKDLFADYNPVVDLTELADSLRARVDSIPRKKVQKEVSGILDDIATKIERDVPPNMPHLKRKFPRSSDATPQLVPEQWELSRLDKWRRALSEDVMNDDTVSQGAKAEIKEFLAKDLRPLIENNYTPLHELNEAQGKVIAAKKKMLRAFGMPEGKNRFDSSVGADDLVQVGSRLQGFGGTNMENARLTQAVRSITGDVLKDMDPLVAIRSHLETDRELLDAVRAMRATQAFVEMGGQRPNVNEILHGGGATAYATHTRPMLRNRIAGLRSVYAGGPAQILAPATGKVEVTLEDVETLARWMGLRKPPPPPPPALPPPPLPLGAF